MRPRLLLLLLALVATPVAAQGVRGVVVTRDTVVVSGAVVSLVDSIEAVGATVLSDEFGRFDLRAPRRGAWRVRVDAVGFAGVLSLPMTLATAEVQERVIHLVDATRRLGAIEVRDRNACDIRPAEGSQVALLWDEARKSLAAAALSADRSALLAFDFDEIEYDSTLTRVRSASRMTLAGRAEQGFRSDAPKALRELGYARRIDTTSTYLGPDARVLLSAEFAATHCFRLVDEDPTSVRRVGLAFAPVTVPTTKLEVAGVLWIDRETFVLDRVEFRYRAPERRTSRLDVRGARAVPSPGLRPRDRVAVGAADATLCGGVRSAARAGRSDVADVDPTGATRADRRTQGRAWGGACVRCATGAATDGHARAASCGGPSLVRGRRADGGELGCDRR